MMNVLRIVGSQTVGRSNWEQGTFRIGQKSKSLVAQSALAANHFCEGFGGACTAGALAAEEAGEGSSK